MADRGLHLAHPERQQEPDFSIVSAHVFKQAILDYMQERYYRLRRARFNSRPSLQEKELLEFFRDPGIWGAGTDLDPEYLIRMMHDHVDWCMRNGKSPKTGYKGFRDRLMTRKMKEERGLLDDD